MSKLVWSIFRHRIIVEHSQGCRIRQLEAVILKIDRMASAWLSHGREEAKPFAREVFDVCEQAIQAASGAVSELAVDSSTPKTAEKPVEQR
jgi:hypothetical protein